MSQFSKPWAGRIRRMDLPMNFLRTVVILSIAASAGETDAPDVARLTWMSGCWVAQIGPLTIEEQWNKPAGGQMMGLGRTIRQGKVVFSEFLRIDQKADGIHYTPRFGAGTQTVSFKLSRQTESEVIFENPEHDFPQRILYRKAAGGLFARIDGVEKGKPRAQEFPMKAADCP